MEEYIDRIEKFLRGQMTQQEEVNFKEDLSKNAQLHSQALSLALILKSFHSRA